MFEGNDQTNASYGNDLVFADEGNDPLIVGGPGDDTLWGGIGNDRLEGSSNNDQLYGETGDDSLDGGSGGDRLAGNTGNDWLHGHYGVDTLVGDNTSAGGGVDTFSFGYVEVFQPALDRVYFIDNEDFIELVDLDMANGSIAAVDKPNGNIWVTITAGPDASLPNGEFTFIIVEPIGFTAADVTVADFIFV